MIWMSSPGQEGPAFEFANPAYNRDAMKTMSSACRAIVVLCMAAILFAALTHPGTGQLVAILAPWWFFFAAIVTLLVRRAAERCDVPLFPVLAVISPRPPPVL
jgi:hypothetical protein